MKVLKFGGTSVGTAERIKNLRHIIPYNEPTIVVLSAMAGVTNRLVQVVEQASAGKKEMALMNLESIEKYHFEVCEDLLKIDEIVRKGKDLIITHFKPIKEKISTGIFEGIGNEILIIGELLSSNLFHLYLNEIQVKSALLPALNFMLLDLKGEPDFAFITKKLSKILDSCIGINILITQGFICRNARGEIDNLKRGGSDYSASIIGNAIGAKEVQIWTDIDGFHNNDPRYVSGTAPIRELSFDEAAELAYFGAKILHPSSINPCSVKNIPVILKNTLAPTDRGTIISSKQTNCGIKAIAAKDGITAIRVKSLRMLMAHGFLKRIFQIFDRFKTPVDMVTTSEVAVTLTIDNTGNLHGIVESLREFSTVEVQLNQTIICVVGDFVAAKPGIAYSVLEVLKDIPICQISYGGSPHNITLLIDEKNKIPALQALHRVVSNTKIVEKISHGNTNL